MSLDGKKIVVIGGSSGIGLAVSKLLAQEGAELAVTGRKPAALEALRTSTAGVRSVAAFDFADQRAVKGFFDSVEPFDHLVVVAAGAPRTRPFLDEGALAEVAGYADQKLWGVLNTAHHGIPRMRRGGSVVFFVGSAGRRAFAGTAPLAVVNSAIIGLAKTLAVEIKPTRVNVVCPGTVVTEAWSYMAPDERARFYQACASANPLGRLGTPEDTAQAVLFLLTAEYVSGIVLDVLGGETVDFMH